MQQPAQPEAWPAAQPWDDTCRTRLRGSQGILGIAKLGKRGGIGVVGIGQLGIGIAQSSLEASGGIDGGLIASVGSVQLDQLLVARRARGKGCLVVDSLKIGLERLVVGKLGLGLDDLEVRIDDGFVGGIELLLGIGDTGDGSVIGGLGVVDRLLGTGERSKALFAVASSSSAALAFACASDRICVLAATACLAPERAVAACTSAA